MTARHLLGILFGPRTASTLGPTSWAWAAGPRMMKETERAMNPLRRLGPCALVLVLALAGAAPVRAQDDPPPRAQGHLAKGDYFFKSGYYLKASEHYRLALLEDPSSPWKKLAFGHALFAIGNYSYSSYALRRGVAQLDGGESFRPDIEGLFPSKRQFTQALRDLKRYVTYSPRDPAGLTVLGYVLFSIQGEERRCRDMFQYLKRLDPNDPFAEFFLAQLKTRGPIPEGADETPLLPDAEVEEPAPPPAPPPPPPAPKPRVAPPPPPPPAPKPDLEKVLGDPERAQERAEGEWPSPVPAPSQ